MRFTATILVAGLVMVEPGAAQEFCLRPEEPFPFEPPRDDPELYAFINEEYQTYIVAMQDYLNCLGEEQAQASRETKEVLDRWISYFGDDAVLSLPMEEEDADDRLLN